MDTILKGLSRNTNIRFAFADVTQTAQVLNDRHGSGRAAAEVLAQALAAAALLSVDASSDDEATLVQLNCDGALDGFKVIDPRDLTKVATGAGTLRGYTRVKRNRTLDRASEPPLTKTLGRSGVLNVVVSTPEKVLYTGQVDASPPEVRSALARYYNHSLQTPSAVEVVTRMEGGRVKRAMALVGQKMPDGQTEAFVQVLEAFHEGRVRNHLEARNDGDPLWSLFGLDDIETVDSRPLSFACRCNQERVVASLAALETEEIRQMVDTDSAQEVSCHMCGETYVVEHDVLLQILVEKAKGE